MKPLALLAALALLAPASASAQASVDREIAELTQRVERLEGHRAVDVVAEGALQLLHRAVAFEPLDTASQLGNLAVDPRLRGSGNRREQRERS